MLNKTLSSHNARNDERTHENILLTVWTTKNQLTSFRQSDKDMLYTRTIFNCEEFTIPFSVNCPQSCLNIGQTDNQLFRVLSS